MKIEKLTKKDGVSILLFSFKNLTMPLTILSDS